MLLNIVEYNKRISAVRANSINHNKNKSLLSINLILACGCCSAAAAASLEHQQQQQQPSHNLTFKDVRYIPNSHCSNLFFSSSIHGIYMEIFEINNNNIN
ncbi:hypothetical protein DERP_012191, partial [Dermatophagoides pteronyssinus]